MCSATVDAAWGVGAFHRSDSLSSAVLAQLPVLVGVVNTSADTAPNGAVLASFREVAECLAVITLRVHRAVVGRLNFNLCSVERELIVGLESGFDPADLVLNNQLKDRIVSVRVGSQPLSGVGPRSLEDRHGGKDIVLTEFLKNQVVCQDGGVRSPEGHPARKEGNLVRHHPMMDDAGPFEWQDPGCAGNCEGFKE